MTSRTTRQFRDLASQLPKHVRQQAREAYRLFQSNPAHPSLHFKQVHPDPPIWSARVGINHRAVGIRHGGRVVWYWIGSHAAYDRVLATL